MPQWIPDLLQCLSRLFLSHSCTTTRAWRKILHLDHHQRVYEQLFSNVDGFTLSKLARQQNDSLDYVYGEIDFEHFVALLTIIKPNSSSIFYDLGSGVGKAVIACMMVFDVKKACGIELLDTLYFSACKQTIRLSQHPDYQKKSQRILFEYDSFLTSHFDDATIIFINSASFFGETWFTLNDKLSTLVQCEVIISISKRLTTKQYHLDQTLPIKMSWGWSQAHIYKRKAIE